MRNTIETTSSGIVANALVRGLTVIGRVRPDVMEKMLTRWASSDPRLFVTVACEVLAFDSGDTGEIIRNEAIRLPSERSEVEYAVEVALNDAAGLPALALEQDSAAESPSPILGRAMTVEDARKIIQAHTGQSMRSILRETRGWTAEKIIGLIA